MVVNVHERTVRASTVEVGELLDGLSSFRDRLWPTQWPPMRFDGPLRAGSSGGHGPVRYVVESVEPGRRVVFRFTRPRGFQGTHEFSVHDAGAGQTTLRHTLKIRPHGCAHASWPLLWRPLHDALMEDCMDRAVAQLTTSSPGSVWSLRVRLLRACAATVTTVGAGVRQLRTSGQDARKSRSTSDGSWRAHDEQAAHPPRRSIIRDVFGDHVDYAVTVRICVRGVVSRRLYVRGPPFGPVE